jgi:hypothetical protein
MLTIVKKRVHVSTTKKEMLTSVFIGILLGSQLIIYF